MIANERLESDSIRKESMHTKYLSQAVIGCHVRQWCTCICQLAGNEFTLTDLYAIRDAMENRPGSQIPCYTVNWRKLIYPSPGSLITATRPRDGKIIDLVPDGIYGTSLGECYFAEINLKGYFLVNLPQITPITELKFGSSLKDFSMRNSWIPKFV